MGVALALLLAAASSQEAQRAGSARGEVRVERVLVDAYVTTGSGDPIPDLSAADFRVTVEGLPVELESLEWIPAGQPEAVPLAPGEPSEVEERPADTLAWPPGRVIVVFVQEDFSRTPLRQKGLMNMGQHLDRFLTTLLPTDRVAVVSYDSHLKLRRDFTADPGEIRAAFFESFSFAEPRPLPPGPFPSLAQHFDYAAAKDAASVDKGMAVVARALSKIPGGKAMLYFGWGFQVDHSPAQGRDAGEALGALFEARVNVFTLDISLADYHTLEARLMNVAELTGGRYEKTHLFTGGALARVVKSLGGRYVLVFVKPEGPRGFHSLSVELTRRKGNVAARAYYQD
jgi:VWFA-related protein